MDDKKNQILRAAMRVVTAYGLKRTSMEDIAQEADVSRPAIYQFFRNKDDVFKSCIDLVIDDAFVAAEAAANRKMDAKAWLHAYVSAYMVYYHGLLIAGPHGQELLEVNNRLGTGQSKQAMERFVGELNKAMGRDAAAEEGMTLALAAMGIKYRTQDAATLKTRLAMLVDRFVI